MKANTMQRRDVLKLLGLGGAAGLSLFTPFRAIRQVSAGENFKGPFLLTIHASGGWDPTLFFDAKPSTSGVQNKLYTDPGTSSTLGLSYAPIQWKSGSTVLDSPQQLLADLGSKFLWVRGLDTQTNSHDTGTKVVWSGKGFEELPSLGALYASSVMATYSDVPVPFLTSGNGYDVTAGLVPLTRVNDASQLRGIARPNRISPNDPKSTSVFFSDATAARIEAARKARVDRLASTAKLPRDKGQLSNLAKVAFGAQGLDALADALPATAVDTTTAYPSLGYDDDTVDTGLKLVELAVTGFSTGQVVAANLGFGSFDTHGNHDVNHTLNLGKLALVVRYAMKLLEAKGLSAYVLVGSDFGRTPTYNAGNGKDHWNVTGMMIAGPGIRAGRTIGATDDGLAPMGISGADTSKIVPMDDPDAIRLTPGAIHRAMRKKLGIKAAAKFELPVAGELDDIL
jgi:hypothetical protein